MRGKCRNVLLLFATLALLFALGEAGTRLYLKLSFKGEPVAALFKPLEGSERAYGLKPGSRALGYSIDSRGFRGREAALQKPDNTFRIISLGDSIAFGLGVKQDKETLSGVLEDMLNKAGLKRRVEVLNAGVPGYNSRYEYLYLKEELAAYGPDLVLLSFCVNDADPVELDTQSNMLVTLPSSLEGYKVNIRTILNMSYFLRAIKNRLLDLSPSMRKRAIDLRTSEKAWDEMKSYIAKMDAFSKKSGFGFLVMVFPREVQLSDNSYPGTHKDLTGFFEEQGIAYLDLYGEFLKHVDKKDLFFSDGVHPTVAGHEIAAEEAFKGIIAMQP